MGRTDSCAKCQRRVECGRNGFDVQRRDIAHLVSNYRNYFGGREGDDAAAPHEGHGGSIDLVQLVREDDGVADRGRAAPVLLAVLPEAE